MPSPPAETFVTGLVLGAGGSKRLGRPKQLLPYGDRPLLEHTLNTARDGGFDQIVVPIGGAAGEVRERVDFTGTEVVVNRNFGEGCSSSIAAALDAVNQRCEVLVLMLGDQPGVTPETVRALLDGPRRRAAGGVPLRRRPRPSDRLCTKCLPPTRRPARRQGRLALARRARRGCRRRAHRRQRSAGC